MLRILQGVCDVFIVMYLYLYVCAWRTLVRVKKNNVFSRLIFDLYIFYMSYAHVISVCVHCLGPIGLRYSRVQYGKYCKFLCVCVGITISSTLTCL